MVDLFALLVNTLAVALVPFLGWASQRWTREARLSARVSRLGSLLALIPVSDQRTALETHVLAAADELNNWIDPIARGVRMLQTLIGVILLALGLTFVFWLEYSAKLDPALSLVVSVSVGTLIAIVTVSSGAALQRLFLRRRESLHQQERLRKIRAGEELN